MEQLNEIYGLLFMGKAFFALIAVIGLIMLIWGFIKNKNYNRRRGLYILIFGAIMAICIHLIEIKTKSNVDEYLDNTFIYQ